MNKLSHREGWRDANQMRQLQVLNAQRAVVKRQTVGKFKTHLSAKIKRAQRFSLIV